MAMHGRVTVGGLPCLSPNVAYDTAVANNTPQEFWGLANSYACPRGFEPGDGWFLLTRAQAAAVVKTAAVSCAFTDGTKTATVSLYWDTAYSISKTVAGVASSAYFVRMKDVRAILQMTCLNIRYNVRKPHWDGASSDSDLYFSETLNGSSEWTWATLVSDVWDELPSVAGAAPSLPFTPEGTPMDLEFIGVSAWTALEQVLDQINCTVALDPIAGTFTIVQIGDTQSGLAAAKTAAAGGLRYSYDPIGADICDVPETVSVFFRVSQQNLAGDRNSVEDDDTFNSPVHVEDKTTSASGVITGTKVCVWDAMLAIVDESGTVTNSSALSDRADEVKDDYVTRFTDDRDRDHYAGILKTLLPGSEVAKVVWRDYGDRGDFADGLLTEVHYGQDVRVPPDAPDWLKDYFARHPQILEGNFIGKCDSTVTARSGTTPGTGTVSLYTINGSGTLVDTTYNVTAKNLSATATASGAYVMMKRDPFSRTFWLDMEDCT